MRVTGERGQSQSDGLTAPALSWWAASRELMPFCHTGSVEIVVVHAGTATAELIQMDSALQPVYAYFGTHKATGTSWLRMPLAMPSLAFKMA